MSDHEGGVKRERVQGYCKKDGWLIKTRVKQRVDHLHHTEHAQKYTSIFPLRGGEETRHPGSTEYSRDLLYLKERRPLRAEVNLPVLDEVVVFENLLPFLRRPSQAGALEVKLGVYLLLRVPFHTVIK